ncbi:NAD(P)/FAD-dependent oxidoreductase [Novosphingobium sp. JCM 18896]|uniref:NAD(P)/FAD-dependent oxidoreductase n=1 Tax=Novosphingobium sp. JCM 18896 TaxID=2989731 RepID=UPI002222E614|nr:FAD-dependent oxidoreductase [Novosphingobium sp. JCM 18896]MCW1432308.1 FAD-dependent oxidoreductase [Novosphingobium sp. JCM 18896]
MTKMPITSEDLVVVGGGQAATQLIEVARQEGYAGKITLISDEPTLPYQRPPLSKQYLNGGWPAEKLLYRTPDFYAKWQVTTCLGSRVAAVDRASGAVELESGKRLPYDRLALATGTRVRRLDGCAGVDDRVFYVRTLDDVDRLRDRLAYTRRIAIIGAGFIGLEAAAVLVQRGFHVTLIAQRERLLPRMGSDAISDFLYDRHKAAGVRFAFDADVAAIVPSGDAIAVVCSDGRHIEADIAIVGIGALPNVELAQSAGLDCENGIVVDSLAVTSDPAIVAAGDCTNHPSGPSGRRVRLETVHNAVEQGRTAGASIAGKQWPYVQTPWVWSDQYGFRFQSVGISDGQDQVVLRGEPATGRFAVLSFAQDQLIGATMINQPKLFGVLRRMLNERIPLSPAEATDASLDIAGLSLSRPKLAFDDPWPPRVRGTTGVLAWGHS